MTDPDNYGGVNGLMLLFLPVFVIIYSIPQIIGCILRMINISVKKYFITIVMFISSLLSIVSIIFTFNSKYNYFV